MRRAVSAFVPEVQAQAKAASLLLLQIVREYFKDPVHEPSLKTGTERRPEKSMCGRR